MTKPSFYEATNKKEEPEPVQKKEEEDFYLER